MSDTMESLRRKIDGAGDLESVVRTMKVLAASNIVQYEKAVISLADYFRTVEEGLYICFQKAEERTLAEKYWQSRSETTDAVIFGSDQGLVGQFNDTLAEFAYGYLHKIDGKKRIWAVGDRMQSKLEDSGIDVTGVFQVPGSVKMIVPLVGQILLETDSYRCKGEIPQLFIFHNKPKPGALYDPFVHRLLPLDDNWRNSLAKIKWTTNNLPEPINGLETTLHGLIREYLFITIFRAGAESLASENASRLAAMQRAEKNIDELLEDLNRAFHRLRQSTIDEELFDVISGSEALSSDK